ALEAIPWRRLSPLQSASWPGKPAGISAFSGGGWIDKSDLGSGVNALDGGSALVFRLNLYFTRLEVTGTAHVHHAFVVFQEQRLAWHVKNIFPCIAVDGHRRREARPHPRIGGSEGNGNFKLGGRIVVPESAGIIAG